jgi:hypothetical protein
MIAVSANMLINVSGHTSAASCSSASSPCRGLGPFPWAAWGILILFTNSHHLRSFFFLDLPDISFNKKCSSGDVPVHAYWPPESLSSHPGSQHFCRQSSCLASWIHSFRATLTRAISPPRLAERKNPKTKKSAMTSGLGIPIASEFDQRRIFAPSFFSGTLSLYWG